MEKVFLDVLVGVAKPGLVHVVRATLDFIYYAHFGSHTADSLRKLEEAWIAVQLCLKSQNMSPMVSFVLVKHYLHVDSQWQYRHSLILFL